MTKTHPALRTSLLGVAALLALSSSPVHATLITGWSSLGFTSGTVTEGAAGSFSTTVSGNLSPQAQFAPIDFSVAGTSIALTGTVTLQNAPGNIQFRFGLFDTDGSADATDWLGYYASPRNIADASGGSVVNGRTDLANSAAVFVSGTDTYGLTLSNLVQNGTAPGGTTFDFNLTITRVNATTVGGSFSFIQQGGSGVTISGDFTDSAGSSASANLNGINAVGFLLNNNTGTGTFSNVDVSVVPEPSTYALIFGAIALGAVALRRRLRR